MNKMKKNEAHYKQKLDGEQHITKASQYASKLHITGWRGCNNNLVDPRG